jgi:hypothetical protein
VLAVQEITASNSCSRSGSSDRRIASPPKRPASFSPRSSVRLAIAMALGVRAAKCVATSSIISPAPTNSTRPVARSSNSCDASRTAAAAMLMECAPISVEVRTSLATAKERWNSWCSVVPSVPASSACAHRLLHLAQDLRLAQHHRIQPGATRKAWRGGPPALATIAHAAINFVVGGTVLALGLWWQGADGRMVTYAALVTVMATLQWLLGRHWR